MATLGQQLTSPESGWRRYNDTDSRFSYVGAWLNFAITGPYLNQYTKSTTIDSQMSFVFFGSKLRIISPINIDVSNKLDITIDGVTESFSEYSIALTWSVLVYEKILNSFGKHNVTITAKTTNLNIIDAIDIDSTGYLLHPSLNQVSDIDNMQIGDCIPCRYTATTSGIAGYFSELGTCIANEIPITGTATPDGLFYFIKSDKGTLIADRVIQTNISWDVLNNAKYIEGCPCFVEDEIVINQTGTVGPIGTAISSGIYSTGTEAWRVFNNDLSDYYRANDSKNVIIGYLFNEYMTVTSLILKSGHYAAGKLQCSTDNIYWFDIDCSAYGDFTNGYTIKIKKPQSYKNYRIISTAQTGGYTQMAQISFFTPGTYADKAIKIRSISGGCAYADEHGNMSLTDKSLGSFPTNNEWDKYIVNSDLNGKIKKGDDMIWNWNNCMTYCKDTHSILFYKNTARVLRGNNKLSHYNSISNYVQNPNNNTVNGWCYSDISGIGSMDGFRPVLNYIEADLKSEVIY